MDDDSIDSDLDFGTDNNTGDPDTSGLSGLTSALTSVTSVANSVASTAASVSGSVTSVRASVAAAKAPVATPGFWASASPSEKAMILIGVSALILGVVFHVGPLKGA
jgi:hypothetical protein